MSVESEWSGGPECKISSATSFVGLGHVEHAVVELAERPIGGDRVSAAA